MHRVKWFGNEHNAPPTLPGFTFVVVTKFVAQPVSDISVGALQQLHLLERVLDTLSVSPLEAARGRCTVTWLTLNRLVYGRVVRADGPLALSESVAELGDALHAGASLHAALGRDDVWLHAETVQFFAGPVLLSIACKSKRVRNVCEFVAVRQVLRAEIVDGVPLAHTFTMAAGMDVVGPAKLHVATAPISLDDVSEMDPTILELPQTVPRLPIPSAGAVLGREPYTKPWPIDASLRGTAARCLCGRCDMAGMSG